MLAKIMPRHPENAMRFKELRLAASREAIRQNLRPPEWQYQYADAQHAFRDLCNEIEVRTVCRSGKFFFYAAVEPLTFEH